MMGSLGAVFIQHMRHLPPWEALIAVGIGMLVESTAVPLPSEVILPLTGIWVAEGKFGSPLAGFIFALAVAIGGSLTGSAPSYAIGFWGGKPFVDRFGRHFLMGPDRLREGENWIKRHGGWSIAIGRVVFGVRHLQSLAAGTLRMSFARFMLSTLAGCAVWDSAGVYLGYRFGKPIESWLRSGSIYLLIVIVAIILILAAVHHFRPDNSPA